MSPIDASLLLKRLEPAVRPVAIGSSPQPHPPLESQKFDELLALVSRGQISSGREVTSQMGGEKPLDVSQLRRLSAAADLAESHGAKNALMLLDGRALVMNVPDRTVAQELGSQPQTSIVAIDAAVYVASDEHQNADGPILPPSHQSVPPAILRQLVAAGERGMNSA